ncbi:MAG: class IV adenylate cyclase [bacterium]|nr:class IV adenylate cyclase [bacterium]
MREIEIKLRVKNFDGLREMLNAKNIVLSKNTSQRDIIYLKGENHSDWRKAKKEGTPVRIRYAKGTVVFNLKQERTGETDNIEYETEVKDGEAIHNILSVMGYLPQVEIKKSRQKGKFGDCELCIDEVEGLGSFVEIEKMVHDDTDPEKVREELFTMAESLGLSRDDEEKSGYDTQIFELRNKII